MGAATVASPSSSLRCSSHRWTCTNKSFAFRTISLLKYRINSRSVQQPSCAKQLMQIWTITSWLVSRQASTLSCQYLSQTTTKGSKARNSHSYLVSETAGKHSCGHCASKLSSQKPVAGTYQCDPTLSLACKRRKGIACTIPFLL